MIKFRKNHLRNKIWWTIDPETGVVGFSFDKEKIYHMWDDYPYNMTAEEVEIFDRENQQWADFFQCRKTDFDIT